MIPHLGSVMTGLTEATVGEMGHRTGHAAGLRNWL